MKMPLLTRPMILLIYILLAGLLIVSNPMGAAAQENPGVSSSGQPAAAGSEPAPLILKLKDRQTAIRAEDLRVDLLLQALGRQAGVNVVVAADITDTITMDIKDLSLYEAFHFIVETKKLRYRQRNNIVLVEKDKVDDASVQQKLQSVRVCPRYGQATEFLEQIRPLVGSGGSLSVVARGSCLIVKDREENIRRISELMSELDRPVPQVHIEARIVTVTKEARERLGVDWSYDNLSTRNNISGSSKLPISGSTTNISFGFLRNNLDLTFKIDAMKEANLLELLSSPSILVLNGKEAEIKQGKEVPYTSTVGTGSTVQSNTSFREATLKLKVTPQIIQDSYINLKVHVTNDSVDESTVGGQPLINKQEISTQLFLKDGNTVVIGGIIQQDRSNRSSRIPGMGDIPLLGHLFKSDQQVDDKTELLVFLTPTLVNVEQMSEASFKGKDNAGKSPDYSKEVSIGAGNVK